MTSTQSQIKAAMWHCTIPTVADSVYTKHEVSDAAPSVPTGTWPTPGILTAKTLQTVLSDPLQTARHDELATTTDHGSVVENVFESPYGYLPRPKSYKRLYRGAVGDKRRNNSSVTSTRWGYVGTKSKATAAGRRRYHKLEPMPATDQQHPQSMKAALGNQTSNGALAVPETPVCIHGDDQTLRKRLRQASIKQHISSERLQSEIQWIHGHFPVLKLATSKCSRRLRQQLFRTALVHVVTSATQRQAWRVWHEQVVDARRRERRRLGASLKLITLFEKASLDRVGSKFGRWRGWVLDCQAQEAEAAAITLQQLARALLGRRHAREFAATQAALLQVLKVMALHVVKIQRAYRGYRQARALHHRVEAAVKIQSVQRLRLAHTLHSRRRHAVEVLQRACRRYITRCNGRRVATIARAFEMGRERQARRIQHAWTSFILWRDRVLPVEVVRALVDSVEFLAAVYSIQRRLRGFQCRFRLQKKQNAAACIQRCWRARLSRLNARQERHMTHLQRQLAASCLQRTFKRSREHRKARALLRHSTCPLYLRARHLDASFRERFRVPIAKSAIVVIQTVWRKHVAREREKTRRVVAVTALQGFLRRAAKLRRWKTIVQRAKQQRQRSRDAAARKLQRWVRAARAGHAWQMHSASDPAALELVVRLSQQLAAVRLIKNWYRRRRRERHDRWFPVIDHVLAEELPLYIQAANRLLRCWRAHAARSRHLSKRRRTVTDVVEQQLRAQEVVSAAHRIQRMFRRAVDRREGRLLLHKYKILLRQDLRRREQRAIIHQFLQDTGQRRALRQQKRVEAAGSDGGDGAGERAGDTPPPSTEETWASGWDPDERQDATAAADAGAELPADPVQYWSEEYQRAYVFDPQTGESTWL